jgi:hypothetical protein
MNSRQPTLLIKIILLILFISTPAFVSAEEKVIKIDPSDVVGMVNMRSEITTMLEDLGYSWYPILNDATQQKIKVAEKYGQWRMLFKYDNDHSIQIEFHIRQTDNMTGLHFTQIGSDEFSDKAIQYYHILKERAIMEYGEDNVSDGYSFFTP